MMKKRVKRLASLFLFCVLLVGALTVEAAAALGTERVTMTENDTRTLYATEAEKSLGWISTNPAVVEVLTQGGNRCEVRAKSEGRAIVYCRYYKTEYIGSYRRFVQHGVDYEITVNAGRIITVTFEPAGGYLSGAWEKEVSGTYGALPAASRNGMTFLGWYTQPEGGNRISASSRVTAKADHTLYAHWQADPLAIPEQETPAAPKQETPAAPEQETPAAPEQETPAAVEKPDKTESAADSKEPAAPGRPQETPPAQSDSAQDGSHEAAEDASQLIIFSPEGGFSERYTAMTNRHGRLTSLPDAVRMDCTFLGWYTAPSGGDKVTNDTVFQMTTTLYAHWSEPQTDTVPSAAAGNSAGSAIAESPSSAASSESAKSPAARMRPVRTRISNFRTITLDTMGGWTLYHRWYTNRYGSMGYLPTPIWNGYTFLGWYTAPQGGELVSVDTVFYEDAVLYAHWI